MIWLGQPLFTRATRFRSTRARCGFRRTRSGQSVRDFWLRTPTLVEFVIGTDKEKLVGAVVTVSQKTDLRSLIPAEILQFRAGAVAVYRFGFTVLPASWN